MTEAETSIEQLTDTRETSENSVIIDEILDEINKTSPQNQEEISHPNITLNEQPNFEAPMQQQQPMQQQPMQQQQDQTQPEFQPQDQQPFPHAAPGYTSVPQEKEEYTDSPTMIQNINSTEDTLGFLKDNILEELKLPTIVLVLFIILSSSGIDNLFVKTHSNFFIDSIGKLTFPSIFIKGILAALIFYVFKLFI